MSWLEQLWPSLGMPLKIVMAVVVVAGVHLLVLLLKRLGAGFLGTTARPSLRKLRSVLSLTISGLIFSLYFLAIGVILREFGVSLTAYLASASIIGLAVGFGSQGVVQDVVTGLTIIFSDLLDIGELVEIAGQTGFVRAIGMRFVELENSLGAVVFVPNRTINNVINYPRGYIRCIADVSLVGESAQLDEMVIIIQRHVTGVYEQFPGVLRTPPSIEGRYRTSAGKDYVRIKFRIWPGRGQPIEETFRKELALEFRRLTPDYQDWMIAIYYEVEQRIERRRQGWAWPRPKATS